MTRLVSRLAGGMAAVLMAMPLAVPAQRVAVPEHVPADFVGVVSVHDASEAWRVFSATPVYEAFRNLMNTPLIRTSEHWQEAELGLDKLSVDTGLDLRPDALFGETIKGVDFYLLDNDGAQHMLTLIRCHSEAKANQIAGVIESAMAEQSQQQEDIGFDAYTRVEAERGGAAVVSWPELRLNYLVKGDMIALASDLAGVDAALASPGESALQANASLANGLAAMGGHEGHILMHLSPEVMGRAQAMAPAGVNMGQYGMGAVTATIALNTNQIVMRSYNGYDQEMVELTERLSTESTTNALDLLGMGSSTMLMGSATSRVDFAESLKFTDEMMGSMAAMTGGFSISGILGQLISPHGISLENEVLPNLKGDMAFFINSISVANIMAPSVDVTLALTVNDVATARDTMSKVESSLVTRLQSQPGAAPVQVAETEVSGARVRSIPLSSPAMPLPLQLAHTVTDDGLLVVGLSTTSVTEALARRASADRLGYTSAPSFAQVRGLFPSDNNSAMALNVSQLVSTITPLLPMVLPMMGADAQQSQALEAALVALRSIGVVTSVQGPTAEGQVGVAVVQFR